MHLVVRNDLTVLCSWHSEVDIGPVDLIEPDLNIGVLSAIIIDAEDQECVMLLN